MLLVFALAYVATATLMSVAAITLYRLADYWLSRG